MKLWEYKDYEEYKFVQVATNVRKVSSVWEQKPCIEVIADVIKRRIPNVSLGICHGTRRGKEQEWFREILNVDVIGTEISHTATDFPHTVEWDFHEVKDEWIDSFDFVYSNSFDHTYDPKKALKAWATCLKPEGYLILQWSIEHSRTGSRHDPFAATLTELIDLLFDEGFELEEIHRVPRTECRSWALFLTKHRKG